MEIWRPYWHAMDTVKWKRNTPTVKHSPTDPTWPKVTLICKSHLSSHSIECPSCCRHHQLFHHEFNLFPATSCVCVSFISGWEERHCCRCCCCTQTRINHYRVVRFCRIFWFIHGNSSKANVAAAVSFVVVCSHFLSLSLCSVLFCVVSSLWNPSSVLWWWWWWQEEDVKKTLLPLLCCNIDPSTSLSLSFMREEMEWGFCSFMYTRSSLFDHGWK